jgi:transcriptional regulator NrdR family protein
MKKKKQAKKTKKARLLIVKRKGHTEAYDERKVYASCFFACRNSHMEEKNAEHICGKVSNAVTKRLAKIRMVSSDAIFRILADELRKHDDDAAFMYATHRDIN